MSWDAKKYGEAARYVAREGMGVVELLSPRAGERILDVGCGDGWLTRELGRGGALVVGVDSDAGMVEAARARGVDAHVGNGEDLGYEDEFDGVFTNAALHWFRDPEAGVLSAARALKGGGRYVGELGGFGNVAAICTALRGLSEKYGLDVGKASPWFFPSEEELGAMLEGSGFRVMEMRLFARPTKLPLGLRGWLETMRRPLLEEAGERAEDLKADAERWLSGSLERGGEWTADYVRLRFAATL